MRNVVRQIVNEEIHVDESMVERVKMIFLDTITAMIMGMNDKELKNLSESLLQMDEGSYEIIGSSHTFSLMDAAMMLGTSSVAVEMDEGNQWSKGHPAVHLLPVFLLYMQQNRAYSGEDFMKDFVKAYEVTTYFGQISTLKKSLHAHGTWGVLGGATALAIIEDTDEETMFDTLNLAATFATPTQWTSALEGANIRNIYIGESIIGAFRARQLINARYKAPHNNVEQVYGTVLGSDFRIDEPVFRQPLAIQQNYFKFHAFCRYAHVPLEAFQSLMKEKKVNIAQIKQVEVETYERASSLKHQEPSNSLSAKFSIPFALAVWAYTGRTDHRIFKEELYSLSKVKELAKKIDVTHNESFDENYPEIMPAKVTITLKSGEVVEQTQNYASGGPNKETTFNDIIKKFKDNTAAILQADGQNKVVQFIRNLEKEPKLYAIFGLVNRHLL